ncbi:MAG: hypothetical protein WDM85_07005 [Caulobacteraceae bacterium]
MGERAGDDVDRRPHAQRLDERRRRRAGGQHEDIGLDRPGRCRRRRDGGAVTL